MKYQLYNIISKQRNIQKIVEELQDYLMCLFPPDNDELKAIAKKIIAHRKDVEYKRKALLKKNAAL